MSMQAEQQSYPWIKELVHQLKWTYGALWTLNTAEGSRSLIGFDTVRRIAEWKDGWYNLDSSRSPRTLSMNDNVVRDESRIEALFYSSYKSCSFQQGLGYVGLVLLNQQSIWLAGSEEVLERAVHTQALFLKTARIQVYFFELSQSVVMDYFVCVTASNAGQNQNETVICQPWNNHVLELGKFEQESRDELVLHQIQRWLTGVTKLPLSTGQPSPGGGGGAVSEDDSGESREEAMQMSHAMASSIFMDGSNVHVRFGRPSSSSLLIKQQQQQQQRNNNNISSNERTSSFSASSITDHDSRLLVQESQRNSFVRYPPPLPPQAAHDEISLLRQNQDVLSRRVPSMTGHVEASSLEMDTSFPAEDWGAGAAAGSGDLFQQVVANDSDPFIPCSGMAVSGISSLLPDHSFSQQQGLAQNSTGGGGRGGLLTSLPMTMAPDIGGSLQLPMDLFQESGANLFGLPPKNNSREWAALEPSKAQSLVQLLEEFTDDEPLQTLEPSPDNVLMRSSASMTVANSDAIMDDCNWVGLTIGTAPISHQNNHHFDQQHHQQQPQQQQQLSQQDVQHQFQFPHIENPVMSNLRTMATPRSALASLMKQQQQQKHQPQQQIQHHRHLLAPFGQQPSGGTRWPIVFTTPSAWVPWIARKQVAAALRYKGRDSDSASHGELRANQIVLKKLLTEMVPKFAKEKKAKVHEAAAAQAQAQETESASCQARMNSTSTTFTTSVNHHPSTLATRQEAGSIQEPQARTHMLAERRRRVRENEHYAALRKLIPPTSRMDKATVLAETIQLVRRLGRRVRHLEMQNPDHSGTPNISMVASEDSQKAITSQASSRGDPAGTTSATLAGAESSEGEDGKTPARDLAPGSTGPSDRKEIVEVDAQAGCQNELRASIRTVHRPDTIIHIFTCFKDLGLRLLSTCITIEKDWVHADFQLQINAFQCTHVSQFAEELHEALRKAIFAAKSSSQSTMEGGSLTEGAIPLLLSRHPNYLGPAAGTIRGQQNRYSSLQEGISYGVFPTIPEEFQLY